MPLVRARDGDRCGGHKLLFNQGGGWSKRSRAALSGRVASFRAGLEHAWGIKRPGIVLLEPSNHPQHNTQQHNPHSTAAQPQPAKSKFDPAGMSSLQIPHSDTMASTSTANTPTITPRLSPNATLVDVNAVCLAKMKAEAEAGASPGAPSTNSAPSDISTMEKSHAPSTLDGGCEVKLSQRKKWSLLLVFSLAMFVDSKCPVLPTLKQPRDASCTLR